jgi:hypothetical protein
METKTPVSAAYQTACYRKHKCAGPLASQLPMRNGFDNNGKKIRRVTLHGTLEDWSNEEK